MKVIREKGISVRKYRDIDIGSFFLLQGHLCIDVGNSTIYDLEDEEMINVEYNTLVEFVEPSRITITID